MAIHVELGTTTSKGAPAPAVLDVDELLATRLLIQGNSGSGKSHLLRRLLEQSAPSVQQVIIDPEGDFVSLSEKYGHFVVDAERSEAELVAVASRAREHRISVVLNLESLDVDMQMKAAAIFLNAMFDAPREMWYPCLVAVDEAQLFAPSAAGDVSDAARKLSLGAMTNLMCRGRKRGLAGIIATQRLAKLAKNVAAEASNFLMGRTFLDIDMDRAADLLGMDKREAEKFRDLGRGSFIALGPALSRKPLPIQVGSVETQARGSTPKLTAPPMQSREDVHELMSAPVASPALAAAAERRAAIPLQPTEDLLSAMSSRVIEEEQQDASVPGLTREEKEKLFRTIVADIMADPKSFTASEASLYQEFQTRVRIKRLPGVTAPRLEDFKRYLTVAKAGIDPELLDTEEWTAVLGVASQAQPDLQSIYLLFARAAKAGEECPSDMTVARLIGTQSTSRAMSRIKALESSGFLVLRSDMRGRRIVQLPDLDCETAAGDPKGPDTFAPPPLAQSA